MRKFVTLIAALVLCFALCISASAAESLTDSSGDAVLTASNAATGTQEVTYKNSTVTVSVYPEGTTFAMASNYNYGNGDIYTYTDGEKWETYVDYVVSGHNFALPSDGKVYHIQMIHLMGGYADYYVTSGSAAAAEPAAPAAKVESVEITDTDTVSGSWTAKITGVFTERENSWNAYDVVVEPDSIIECYDPYSKKPLAYSTIEAYNWNGSEYVNVQGLFTATTATAAEVFAACGNPDMLRFADFNSGKTLYVTLAGAAEPTTPAEPVESFTDIAEGETFYDAIAYVTKQGLMDGTTATAFERKTATTNKAVLDTIGKLAGADAAKAWASQKGLTETAEAVREDLITMLWIAGGKKAADESVLAKFADAAAISAEAKTAMAWAVETGLVQGYANGLLGAQSQLTRGAMAAILFRAAA